MLALSIGLWCVVVCNLRVAFAGNPLYLHLVRANAEFLRGLDKVASGGRAAASEPEVRFLRRFSRLTLLELAVFVLEMSLLVYLWLSRTMEWLSFALLVKNLFLFALSAAMAPALMRESLFQSLVVLPSWLIRLDRLSALISGAGAFVLFLGVNGIQPW